MKISGRTLRRGNRPGAGRRRAVAGRARTETRLADVHKQLATLQYADAQSVGAEVERSQSLALERRVPMLGKTAETERAPTSRATAGYWRTDYAAIAPPEGRQRRRHRGRPRYPAAERERGVSARARRPAIGSTPSDASTPSSRATPRC